MSEALVGVALVTLAGVARVFLIGEAKGWLNDLLRGYAKAVSAKIPSDCSADTSEEWDAELISLVDRPIRALLYARGLRRASRAIASYVENADPGAMGVDIGEFIHRKTGVVVEAKPSRWGFARDGFVQQALAEECATLGVTEDELVGFAVLYYLADLDSGRTARPLPPAS